MICPHCKKPMPDEALFCENCGKERQLVPEFEAEINESLEDAISSIAVDLANTQEIVPQDLARHEVIKEQLNIEAEKTMVKEPAEEETKGRKEGSALGRRVLIIVGVGVILILLTAVFINRFLSPVDTSSYEYQLEQAKLYESQGNYEQMLLHSRRASEIAANSSDAKMMVAKAYAGLGRTEEQKIVLEGLIITDPTFADAYQMLIPMYESGQEYDKIAKLLENCPDQTVIDKYSIYIANPPEFSLEPGIYEESASLKLLASGAGTIYYTTDGSTPDETSQVYTVPIILGEGTYKISCIYCNSYGILSEVSQAQYTITHQEGETVLPEVKPETGSYNQPQIITVEMPEEGYQIYYTTDGSDPGLESKVYSKPIPMPLGESHYKFALFDEDGNGSESVEVSYQLAMQLELDTEQARNLLTQALIGNGSLISPQGDIEGGGGRRTYSADSVFIQSDGYYYLLVESFESDDGTVQSTGNMYAVSASTGQSYTVTEDEMGRFHLGSL
ncbi:MAG: chitobiase/beta-hexosaminidase C-terminal domain-containing protein [Lachnospiraceae bacterium]|nr:chitobiase/beta-hexosaminidase C-terminal domain-containing protein [Lachnospiraceae bacterium]